MSSAGTPNRFLQLSSRKRPNAHRTLDDGSPDNHILGRSKIMARKPRESYGVASEPDEHGPIPTVRIPRRDQEDGFLQRLQAQRAVLQVGEDWNHDLGHFEGRGWRGFHHHATLCIAAYGFLISERETLRRSCHHALPAICLTRRLPARRIRR